MKNYRINTISDIFSMSGSRCLTKEQDSILKIRGFRYNDFPRRYEKSYYYNPPYGNIDMVLFLGKNEFLRFFQNRYILPCELGLNVGEHYKKLIKMMFDDIKNLKEVKILI